MFSWYQKRDCTFILSAIIEVTGVKREKRRYGHGPADAHVTSPHSKVYNFPWRGEVGRLVTHETDTRVPLASPEEMEGLILCKMSSEDPS